MTLSRRHALALLSSAAAVAASPRVALAARRPIIMMITWRGQTEVEAGFLAQLREEGIEAEIVWCDAGQDVRRVADFVAEAKQTKPDLVYVWGTPAALAAVGSRGEVDPRRHLMDIPVVFTMVAAPVAARLVDGSRLSGRNVTGASHVVPVPDQLKAMRTYRRFARLGVVYNPAEANSVITVNALREEARLQSFTLIEEPLALIDGTPDPQDLGPAVTRLAARDPQFLYLGPDSFVGARVAEVTERALEVGLPAFSATEPALRSASALFGLVSRYDNVGRLTARKAAQILRDGQHPAHIPVETLTRFSLLIRMDVARRLNVFPPMSMLDYAELIG